MKRFLYGVIRLWLTAALIGIPTAAACGTALALTGTSSFTAAAQAPDSDAAASYPADVYAAAARVAALPNPTSQSPAPVQIFDVGKEQVVHVMPNSPEIQREARIWISSIQGPSARIAVDPKDGTVIRIPIQPPIPVKNQWLNATVTDLFLFYHPKDQPRLLLFDSQSKPHLFEIKHPIAPFIAKHKLEPYVK